MFTPKIIKRLFRDGIPSIVFGGLILVLGVVFAASQGRITLQNGHPYDSDQYFRLAQQVEHGAALVAGRAFAYRIGLPYLVGKLFPGNLMEGFRALNLVFGALSIILLYNYLSFLLRKRVTVQALVLLFAVIPIGPLRLPHYSPVQTDPAALTFLLLLLNLVARARNLGWARAFGLAVICFVGCLFRESVIFGALVVWACHGIRLDRLGLRAPENPRPLLSCLPLLMGVLAIGLTHHWVNGQGQYSVLEHSSMVFQRHLEQGTILPLAWFNVYGPLVLLVLIGLPREGMRLCREHPSVLFYLLGILLVSFLAGTHTDRFAFWGFPAVLVLMGAFLEDHWVLRVSWAKRWLFFGPLLVAQGFALRLFAEIPDDRYGSLLDPGTPAWMLFAPFGEGSNAAQMFAAYMSPDERYVMLLQYLGLFVFALLVLAFLGATAAQHPGRQLLPQRGNVIGGGRPKPFPSSPLLGSNHLGPRSEKQRAGARPVATRVLDR